MKRVAKITGIVLASYMALAMAALGWLHFDPAMFVAFENRHPQRAQFLSEFQRWYEIRTMDHISKDPIVAKPSDGQTVSFSKSPTALDDCRAFVHAHGGGLCEVVDPKPGMYFAYPDQGIPAEPRDAKICRIGKTCPNS
jgi:hypothetical protein